MRILGIDPGTTLIGYGLIETKGRSPEAVDYGVLRTPSNTENIERVKLVYDFFIGYIKKNQPALISLERLFFLNNAKTAMAVSEIRGVILLAAASSDVETVQYTPLQVKQAVSAYGRASKQQIQDMVKLILSLKVVPTPDDAADALAVAICAGNSRPLG